MLICTTMSFVFFFNDTATTEIYTLSLHDALPISPRDDPDRIREVDDPGAVGGEPAHALGDLEHDGNGAQCLAEAAGAGRLDRKSTRLNSSHLVISYAVFCLQKNNNAADLVGLVDQ